MNNKVKHASEYPAAQSGCGEVGEEATSVIIVNFNAGQYLTAAVESVLDQDIPVEVIVVDNHSSDDSLEYLAARIADPRVSVVRLEKNFGFAHACNAGIAKAKGSTFLMFNPDCRMAPGALHTLRSALSSGDKLGMAGPLLVNPDGTEQRGGRRDIPNPWQIFCMTLQFHRLMPNHPRFRSINLHNQPIPERPVPVQAISGACMLVKRSVVEKVGTLDRAFFMHFEDLDWCLRFSQAGFGIIFVPQAVVEHTQGVCSRGRVRRVAYHKHRSLLVFLDKHFTQYYPSLFMAVVSCAVTVRFFLVALASLFNSRPIIRDPWDNPVRRSDGPGEKPDGVDPGESGNRPVTALDGLPGMATRLARIATAAIIAKYRLTGGRGFLVLFAAIFDPYLYALTVYFVLATVFKLDSIERFHILLIGFMAFRWGMSSLLGSANLTGILRRMAEHSTTPLTAAVIAVTAPPAFVFFLSLTSAFVFALLMDLPQQSLSAAGWLPFVIAVQAVWTVALILILAFLKQRRVLSSDMPVVVVASLLWILSPVMYTFRDIPEGASKLLTSYNPVSHLLAAYQNAYWYGQNISLEVIPVLTVFGAVLIWILGRFAFHDARRRRCLPASLAPAGGIHLVCMADGQAPLPTTPHSSEPVVVFAPWRARFTDLRGRDLVRMLVANWDGTRAERMRHLERIAENSATGRLFDDFLAIYPDQALDQLAFAVAIQSPQAEIALDGLFDTPPTPFLPKAWQQVQQAADGGRAVTVACYRRPAVPDFVTGTFEVEAVGIDRQHGDIGPALQHALDRVGRAESRGGVMEKVAVTDDPQMPLPFANVLVTGGSSQIGQCVLKRLATAGVPAFAVGRNKPPDLSADCFIRGDLTEDALEFPERLDAVVHIAGLWYLPGHIDALHARGVRRIVCFSTTSIFVKQDSSDAWERDLVARMVNAEASVTARCAALGIACTILRPTLVYGLGIDRNISRAAVFIRRFRFYPLAGDATGLRQPVHADDLAAAALTVLNTPAAAGKCYEVGGGERLVYREMIGRLFDVMGMPRRFIPIPGLGYLAAIAGFVLRRPEVTGEMVQRMRRDLVCDNGPATRDFGYNPRPFLSAGRADLPNVGDATLTP